MRLRNDAGENTIRLNGQAGDIILTNGDAAEHFALADDASADPGTVMVLTDDGTIEPSSKPHDRNAVGVVSGAGSYRPGIVLDHKGAQAGRVPISILGKVSCKVDASHGRIRVGDLLASSPTPGHAMRVDLTPGTYGSVIGKALTPLDKGIGLVDVLIALK